MTYSLRIKSSAAKEIAALPVADRTRVVAAIDALRDDPRCGSQLKGGRTGLRRLRVGTTYRIIHEVQSRAVGARDLDEVARSALPRSRLERARPVATDTDRDE